MTSHPHPGRIRAPSAKHVVPGGKGGKTAGRGSKGQRARNTVARGFEGGQTPLKQRVPKLSGFNNPFRVEYQAINLHALNDLAESLGQSDIMLDDLVASGLLTKGDFAKILARGEITAKVNVHAPRRIGRCCHGHRGRWWLGHADHASIHGRGQGRSSCSAGQPVRQPLITRIRSTLVVPA